MDKRFWLRLTAGETAGVIDGAGVEETADLIDGAAVEEKAGNKDGAAVGEAAGATEALTSSAGKLSGFFPEAAGVTKLVQTWDQRSRAISWAGLKLNRPAEELEFNAAICFPANWPVSCCSGSGRVAFSTRPGILFGMESATFPKLSVTFEASAMLVTSFSVAGNSSRGDGTAVPSLWAKKAAFSRSISDLVTANWRDSRRSDSSIAWTAVNWD